MVFEPQYIKNILSTIAVNMRPSGSVVSCVRVGSTATYTITSDKTLANDNIYSLTTGQYVDLSSTIKNCLVTNVSGKTFQCTVSDMPSPIPAFTSWTSQAPYYLHGHVREISEILAEKSKTSLKYQKYPLVILIEDLKERAGKDTGQYCEPEINIIIATLSDPTYQAEQRYTSTFIPVLYPLYNSFLNQLHYSRHFKTYSPRTINHTKINRLYWGKGGEFANAKNIFGDWLDAIEINDLQLTVEDVTLIPENQINNFKFN